MLDTPCAFFTETLPRPWTWEAGFLLTCLLARLLVCECLCYAVHMLYISIQWSVVKLCVECRCESFLSLGAGWKTGIRTSVADVDCYHSPKCILSVIRLRSKNYQINTREGKKRVQKFDGTHTLTPPKQKVQSRRFSCHFFRCFFG